MMNVFGKGLGPALVTEAQPVGMVTTLHVLKELFSDFK